MQNRSQQQAYDRGITIFSPDGRLYQVEYAREAVKRGTATVGLRTSEGIVFGAVRQVRSPLMERSSIEKIHRADDHIGIASAGHVADARQLVDVARQRAQVERLRYGEPIGVEPLTRAVTSHIQEYTQSGGARPFGVALLTGGIDDSGPRLFETDPSGTDYEWQAVAIGGGREEIQRFLEDHYQEDFSLEEGIDLTVSTLSTATDDTFGPDDVDIATVETETEAFRSVPRDEIAAITSGTDGENE